MTPLACTLAVLLALEAAPAGPPECPLTDNRCKAEHFVQRAATAVSSAVRAKYLEAAHGSYLALYDASGDVRDLCAARRTFDQTLAALGADAASNRLAPLQEALEKREQARRPRCAAGPRKPPSAPALARTGPNSDASLPPPPEHLPQPPPPEPRDDLMPVSTAPRALAAASTSTEAQSPFPARLPTPREAPGPAGPTPSARADRRLLLAGSVTAGLGFSLVGVAAYAGSQRIEARRASLDLLAEAQGNATAEQTTRDLALRDRYRTMGHLALGTSLVGGAAVLVGTTLAVVGGRRLARITRRMALGPVPGGLVFRARF